MNHRNLVLMSMLMLILFISNGTLSANNGPTNKKNNKDKQVSKLGEYKGYNQAAYKGFDYSSKYISMPDGIRLATDLYLPKKLSKDTKVPTIVYFVRYGRSLELKGFVKFLSKPFFGHVKKAEVEFFTSHGYACLVVDLRGSGASFGHRTMEFSPEEVKDMSHILDWIIGQAWSDGKTATTGISYTGTTAELALSSQHPSLKACIARCNIFDLYTDMNLPGGIRQSEFIQIWKKTTQALDRNELAVFGPTAKRFLKGLNPVQDDKNRNLLNSAVEGHYKNFDIFTGLMNVAARNDVEPETGLTCDEYSIHRRIKDIEMSKVPIYRISGWYDGVNVGGIVKGFWNVKNTERVLIGPWDHGPEEHISPFAENNKVKFDLYSEMLRFFDYHVKGIENGIEKEDKFHYYQMGQEKFKSSNVWPLENLENRTLFLNSDKTLRTTSEKSSESYSIYKCDYEVGTGGGSRYNSLTPLFRYAPIAYKNRNEMNKRMLLFDTEAIEKDTEISGHPIVEIFLSADAVDADLFAYLEDLAPDGTVNYITEGMLRASHRKITSTPEYIAAGPAHSFKKEDMKLLFTREIALMSFDMQPISYQLKKGHKLRLSLAAADVDHFEINPKKPQQFTIYHDEKYPSKVVVPIVK
jgi:uncharacterized protein